jgi:GxxExxY protein
MNTGSFPPLVHENITDGILEAARKVHSSLGPGLFERPYKLCMCHELKKRGISFEAEKMLPVVYDGLTISPAYRADLVVENVVIVEIKAVEALLPVHESQLMAYLKLARLRVGLLINFNVTYLKQGIRRRVCGY